MKVSSVGSYSGSMRLKSSCGKYGETTYQSVHAVPKRKYGCEPSFFFNTEYSFSHRLMVSETLIYRELQILLLTKKRKKNMKKILNIISVASNLAIIVGLVTDTYFRVRGARQKTTVTNLENDEV